jgi:hypothetical protein
MPAVQTVKKLKKQRFDKHGGIVKGGWESPLHVQSMQNQKAFSDFAAQRVDTLSIR